MASKVPQQPIIPSPPGGMTQIMGYIHTLVRALHATLTPIAMRLNVMLAADGTERMTAPLPLSVWPTGALPNAALYNGAIIYVSNETGGAVPAFSDGTNWRRVTDRAIVS